MGFSFGDEKLPMCLRTMINHYKDPRSIQGTLKREHVKKGISSEPTISCTIFRHILGGHFHPTGSPPTQAEKGASCIIQPRFWSLEGDVAGFYSCWGWPPKKRRCLQKSPFSWESKTIKMDICLDLLIGSVWKNSGSLHKKQFKKGHWTFIAYLRKPIQLKKESSQPWYVASIRKIWDITIKTTNNNPKKNGLTDVNFTFLSPHLKLNWFLQRPHLCRKPPKTTSRSLGLSLGLSVAPAEAWGVHNDWSSNSMEEIHPGRLTAGSYSHHPWKERKMIWSKPQWFMFHVNLPGCTNSS